MRVLFHSLLLFQTTLKKHLKVHCKPDDLCSKHISIRKHPKTKETGRRDRKDKGAFRNSTALKIAGLLDLENEIMPKSQEVKGEIEKPTVSEKIMSKSEKEERIDTVSNTIINISLEHIDEMETRSMPTTTAAVISES